MSAAHTGTRYECANNLSVLCSRGTIRPTRKSCAYCGGRLRVEHGLWGVFTWTATNRYPAEAAHSTHASRKAAEKMAGLDTSTSLVVRFIPEAAA